MTGQLSLVVSFFFFGIVNVHPRLAQQVAEKEKIHSDLPYENFNFDQMVHQLHSQSGRLSRLIRGVPDPDDPYPGRWNREPTAEQRAAMERLQRNRLEESSRTINETSQRLAQEERTRVAKAKEASERLAEEERARKRGEEEHANIRMTDKKRWT